MLVTEEDAKGKRCPHDAGQITSARAYGDGLRPVHYVTVTCVGSECMAWRWGDWEINPKSGRELRAKPIAGYCGLSGEPR